ncbi:hypothetical protein RSOLAG1IB_11997 [Rhizoctonia solani AG-1 IB]|uniref:Uncharacterized protein n=1 Tax=Thanatephorus cucumeris (strain AG1-IB / isolate 7/3/14) TaxID=1108050 RepID=A0A0B7FIH2_THACB|nr:hypothetical protein RSOLAG1IB_11997 [Rhizoctonia solani AG-1 IB]
MGSESHYVKPGGWRSHLGPPSLHPRALSLDYASFRLRALFFLSLHVCDAKSPLICSKHRLLGVNGSTHPRVISPLRHAIQLHTRVGWSAANSIVLKDVVMKGVLRSAAQRHVFLFWLGVKAHQDLPPVKPLLMVWYSH